MIGLAVDDGDPSALPLDADADLAFAVVNASCRRHQEHPWVALAASGPWIAGADFGQRLVGLGRNLLSEALVRSLVVVVPAELIAQRLQLVDVVGGSAGLAVASMAKRAGSSRVICVPSIDHRSFGAKRSKRRHSGTERRLVRGV